VAAALRAAGDRGRPQISSTWRFCHRVREAAATSSYGTFTLNSATMRTNPTRGNTSSMRGPAQLCCRSILWRRSPGKRLQSVRRCIPAMSR
jgi:hypothetical protein